LSGLSLLARRLGVAHLQNIYFGKDYAQLSGLSGSVELAALAV
jgi:hypothetical protein